VPAIIPHKTENGLPDSYVTTAAERACQHQAFERDVDDARTFGKHSEPRKISGVAERRIVAKNQSYRKYFKHITFKFGFQK